MARTQRRRGKAQKPSSGAARNRWRTWILPSEREGPPDWIALGLVAVALLVRLPHLGWGLPEVEEEALPMKHALAMWGWERGQVVLDPGVAGWPSLSFYLQLALQHLHYVAGRVTGLFSNRDDYFVSYSLDHAPLLLLARGASVAATLGVVWCGARLARRLAGTVAALLVGGLLALSPMLVEYAQLVTPDVWVALFTALAVSRIVDVQQRGATHDYVWAGIWIGLGISSKYTPALLLPALFAAHALRKRPGVEAAPARRRLTALAFARKPWLGVATAVAAFALTSPFLLLDLPRTLRQVGQQTIHMTRGHFGGSQQPAAVEYFLGVLPQALGWPGLALSLIGLAWACVRLRGPWLALAACIVPFYVGLSLLETQFPRYVLPLLMPIAVGLGAVVVPLSSMAARVPRVARVAAIAAIAIAALWAPALSTWRYHVEKSRPSAQHLANRIFLDDPALRKSHIATEVLGLSLPTSRMLDAFPAGLLQRLTTAQRQRLLSRPAFDMDAIPMYSVQPELSAFYYDIRHYLAHDYVAVSQGIRDRYLMDPARFPAQVGFYRDLDRYATLVHRFGPEQNARPPEIRIYRIPEDASALLRERGPVDLNPDRLHRISSTDFMFFVEGVSRAAYAKENWAMAARYYRLMWEFGPRAGMAPEQRDALARMVDQLEARAGLRADSLRR